MKTKLLAICAALLTLGSLSSCVAPYGYNRAYVRRPYHGGYRNHYARPSTSMGGYRGGGAGGGLGGNFGGF
ncbi:hypothetical protein [Prosthecobacter sp.]|uniref:hypothetical protein n=1 Tax=Prosthecobacter sp. TaxID=1965333 RepID=UPI003782F5C1